MYDMCMCLARGGVGGGFTNSGGTWGKWDMCLRFGCGGVGGRLGPASGRVGGLVQSLGGWGGVMYVCVVSLDSLCRWQVQVSVYCARWIPAHLWCTQCSMMLHLIDIYFLTCIIHKHGRLALKR